MKAEGNQSSSMFKCHVWSWAWMSLIFLSLFIDFLVEFDTFTVDSARKLFIISLSCGCDFPNIVFITSGAHTDILNPERCIGHHAFDLLKEIQKLSNRQQPFTEGKL